MTKKHFEAFAAYIRTAPESEAVKHKLAQMVIAIATRDNGSILDNPKRFQIDRFLTACGLGTAGY